jgi:hypothetical protein
MVERIVASGLQAWRAIAGENGAVERWLRQQYRLLQSKTRRTYKGENFITCWSTFGRDKRIGIYVRGSCDLVSILFCQPLIHPILRGTCCVIREGLVSDSHSDLLLQTLEDLPREWLAPVIEKLKLPATYFQPRLFDEAYMVPGPHGPEEFPKRVIFLSIAADVSRTLYRHRQHGFLVDPGEWWLGQSVQNALADLSTATWFWENFVSVGKIGVDAFQGNVSRIVNLLKRNTGAHILVFNMLTGSADALAPQHQTATHTPQARRREFNIALAELSPKLDFAIVDVDRLLKTAGVVAQLGSLQFPPERDESVNQEIFRIIAHEAFLMMRKLAVF